MHWHHRRRGLGWLHPSALLVHACAFAGLLAALPGPAAAESQAVATVTVTAQFHSRTSLRVSAHVLHFDVIDPAQPAMVGIDFEAGARTLAGSDVVLSVEPARALDGPGGAADVEASLSFQGSGDGVLAGALDARAPTVAGRWRGSGLRSGRLTFSLRAAAAGSYTVPVRFVLSTP
jgi:hypothetical protein